MQVYTPLPIRPLNRATMQRCMNKISPPTDEWALASAQCGYGPWPLHVNSLMSERCGAVRYVRLVFALCTGARALLERPPVTDEGSTPPFALPTICMCEGGS